PGPMSKGLPHGSFAMTRGKVIEGTITVTEYEPVRAFAAISRFGPFTLRQRASLESAPGGTTQLHLAIDSVARVLHQADRHPAGGARHAPTTFPQAALTRWRTCANRRQATSPPIQPAHERTRRSARRKAK